MERAFFKVPEVAEIIGLGKSLTYRLVAEGQIPSVMLAGCRSRRVSSDALKAWIEAQKQKEEGAM
jgi:excisionase family DNA binding protein